MLGDILVLGLIIAGIPILTYRAARLYPGLRRLRGIILWVAGAWLTYAFVHAEVSEMLFDLAQADSVSHARAGQRLALFMQMGAWRPVWEYLNIGNPAFHVYLGFYYFLLDANRAPQLMNMFLSCWGSLTLASLLISHYPLKRASVPWLLVICFIPSLIFWATPLLKEALMYWAITQFYATAMEREVKNQKLRVLRMVPALLVGGAMRPHFMAVWGGAMSVVSLLTRGRRIYAVIALLALPGLLYALETKTRFGMSVSGAEEYLDDRLAIHQGGRSAGSDIDFGRGGPTFFVTGAATLFLRPFLWEVRSISQLTAGLEIWLLTGGTVFFWLRLGRRRRRELIHNPLVQLSLVVAFFFSAVYTWETNVGTMVRQRLQMMPALLTLLGLPWLALTRDLRLIRRGPGLAGSGPGALPSPSSGGPGGPEERSR